MTLAPYEAVKVGHLKGLNDHQRALLAVGSYGRDEMRKQHRHECPLLAVKRTSARISGMSASDPKRTSTWKFAVMHNAAICRLAPDLWLRERRIAICGMKSALIRDNGDFDDPDA
jgi:hypothetical protein